MNPRARGLLLIASAVWFLLSSLSLAAERAAVSEELAEDASLWVEKAFLVMPAGSDYERASSFARRAARRLGIRLDLRDLLPHQQTGLTFSESVCTESGGEYPCYFPRGRFDDGLYVSLEYSDGYLPNEPAQYLVVIASWALADEYVRFVIAETKKRYRAARIITTKVWMGCAH